MHVVVYATHVLTHGRQADKHEKHVASNRYKLLTVAGVPELEPGSSVVQCTWPTFTQQAI